MFTFSLPVEASIAAACVPSTLRPLPRSARIVGGAWHDRGVLPPRCLHESDRGSWRVVTQTSAHLIDLDALTVTRIEGAGEPTTDAEHTVSALRRDREITPLLELVRCQVGYPMQLLLRIRDDCVTLRRTTSVMAITPAEEWSPRA
jgi:hypothetical protein